MRLLTLVVVAATETTLIRNKNAKISAARDLPNRELKVGVDRD